MIGFEHYMLFLSWSANHRSYSLATKVVWGNMLPIPASPFSPSHRIILNFIPFTEFSRKVSSTVARNEAFLTPVINCLSVIWRCNHYRPVLLVVNPLWNPSGLLMTILNPTRRLLIAFCIIWFLLAFGGIPATFKGVARSMPPSLRRQSNIETVHAS